MVRCANLVCSLLFRIAGIEERTAGGSGRLTKVRKRSASDEGAAAPAVAKRVKVDAQEAPQLRGRAPRPVARFVAEPAPSCRALHMAARARGSDGAVLPSELRPRITKWRVEEYAEDDPEYAAAAAEASWERLNAWANSAERTVVRRKDLRRLFDFTTKIFLVRRASDGRLGGVALVSEACALSDVCDTLHSHRNPTLPLVKTARMQSFGKIAPSHIRAPFHHLRGVGGRPIDELVRATRAPLPAPHAAPHLRRTHLCDPPAAQNQPAFLASLLASLLAAFLASLHASHVTRYAIDCPSPPALSPLPLTHRRPPPAPCPLAPHRYSSAANAAPAARS